jgi:rare lipoprotein A
MAARATRAGAPALLGIVVGLAGCVTHRPVPPVEIPGTAPLPPPGPQATPDVVPRVEPRSRSGNPPFYSVFGHRYYVLSSSVAYVERGVASWYGPGFHKVRTSTGERYDMYGMSAAHKTLPLPAYVRVTNLQNGRSVVVRVNDRGPFVGNRIIDLSYTAAARLDMLRNGTAMVEVRALDPSAPQPAPPLLASAPVARAGGQSGAAPSSATAPPSAGSTASAPGVAPGSAPAIAPAAVGTAPPAPQPAPGNAGGAGAKVPLFIQAGAFADPANAERLAARLRSGAYGNIVVRDDVLAGRKMYRVRIGPVANVPEFDRIVAALERAGVHDAHLALD